MPFAIRQATAQTNPPRAGYNQASGIRPQDGQEWSDRARRHPPPFADNPELQRAYSACNKPSPCYRGTRYLPVPAQPPAESARRPHPAGYRDPPGYSLKSSEQASLGFASISLRNSASARSNFFSLE